MSVMTQPQMRKALAKVAEMRANQASKRQIQDYLRAEFGPEENPRFAVRCRRCEDTGVVMIYRPEVVAAARKDPDNTPYHRDCAVRCTCEAAEAKGAEWRGGVRLPIFGERKWHIAVNDPDGRAKCAMYQPIEPYAEFADFS